MKNFWKRLKKGVKAALFPEHIKCIRCGCELPESKRYDLCEDCFRLLPFNDRKVCVKCGCHVEGKGDFCLRCMNTEYAFFKARSALIYEAAAKDLIYEYKFNGKRYLAKPFAQMLADAYAQTDFEFDVAVPVPMTKISLKKRGFHPSALLTKEFCAIIGKEWNETDLKKEKHTHTQVGLSGAERRDNLKGAFRVSNKQAFYGKKVLIVDDVKTTGATIHECAKTLRKAGANEVYALTLASVKQAISFENDKE